MTREFPKRFALRDSVAVERPTHQAELRLAFLTGTKGMTNRELTQRQSFGRG